ncbi:MAG TPA: cytochrome c [Gemmatimonadales bacterium]|jgi:mono/diheme cytochrome c family protein|nr:cytochrome c [Gemmatimonadales bacterium]
MALEWRRGSLLAGLFVLGVGLGVGGGTAAAQAPACAVQPDAALAKRGQSLFSSRGCVGCHSIGQGKRAGPDLAGVTQRRDLDWLRRWMKNPTPMFETDSLAKALLAQFNNTRMPNLRLKDDEVEALLHYIAQESHEKCSQ